MKFWWLKSQVILNFFLSVSKRFSGEQWNRKNQNQASLFSSTTVQKKEWITSFSSCAWRCCSLPIRGKNRLKWLNAALLDAQHATVKLADKNLMKVGADSYCVHREKLSVRTTDDQSPLRSSLREKQCLCLGSNRAQVVCIRNRRTGSH